MTLRQTALVAIVAAQLTACTLVVEVFEADVAEEGDGNDHGGSGVDAGSDDIECEGWAVQPTDFDPCTFVEPTGSLDLRNGSWRYDTSTGILRSPDGVESTPTSELHLQSGADDIRVLSVTDLRIGASASLRAEGAYPLFILSFDEIAVEGQLSVASTVEGRGAGADSPLCGSLAGRAGDNDQNTGSGGGGGSLRAEGGDGGDIIVGDGENGGSGGDGGDVLTSFRGGCPGGSGGAIGGQPGSGGGGLLLMARNQVRVSGQIGAGGQGALPTPAGGGGGGGGGSGGLIAINAEQITVADGAVVASNGGAGAEGSGFDAGRSGDDGQLSSEPAFGGEGSNARGAGGRGGALAQPAGSDGGIGYSGGGGGGGGGSVGVVIFSAIRIDVASGAVMSPALTTP